MDVKRGFSLSARMRGFRFAFEGLWFVLKTQHNAWLHVAAAVLACALGLSLGISRWDWMWLVFAICLVWIAEILNTAFEHLCDVVSPQMSHSVKRAKDVAAGAVLIAAAGALVIGGLIFLPYLTK